MDGFGPRRKLGADFSHAVAQRDHVVELLRDKLGEVLGATTAEVDTSLAAYPFPRWGEMFPALRQDWQGPVVLAAGVR